jgi:hypothetical protein
MVRIGRCGGRWNGILPSAALQNATATIPQTAQI